MTLGTGFNGRDKVSCIDKGSTGVADTVVTGVERKLSTRVRSVRESENFENMVE